MKSPINPKKVPLQTKLRTIATYMQWVGHKYQAIPAYDRDWNTLLLVIQKLTLEEPHDEKLWEHPTDDLYSTVFFDIEREFEEVYMRVVALIPDQDKHILDNHHKPYVETSL